MALFSVLILSYVAQHCTGNSIKTHLICASEGGHSEHSVIRITVSSEQPGIDGGSNLPLFKLFEKPYHTSVAKSSQVFVYILLFFAVCSTAAAVLHKATYNRIYTKPREEVAMQFCTVVQTSSLH